MVPVHVETTTTSAKSLLPVPLSTVTLALRDKTLVVNLPHVLSLVSNFLDNSVNIPLHQACATGSLALLDRIWFHSQFPRNEGWRWCPAVSLQNNRHYKRWQFSQSLVQAVRRRDLAMVEWIFSHFSHCVSDVEVVEEATLTGQLDIFKVLLENNSGHTQEEYEVGYGVGGDGDDRRVVSEINGVTWSGRDMAAERNQGGLLTSAVVSGDLPLVQWLFSQGFLVQNVEFLVDVAADEGHLPLLQWLVEQRFAGNERRVQFPSKHLNVIKWLDESDLGNGASDAFIEACGDGPLPVVWWLADHVTANGVAIDPEAAQTALESAASAGRLDVVRWLLSHNIGNESTFALNAAASNGHLDVAKYLHSQGLKGFQRTAFENAAKNGHLNVVQWMWSEFSKDQDVDLLCVHGKREFVSRAPPLTREMSEAASNGHLAVIQYLYNVALSLAGKKRKRGENSRHSSVIEMEYVVVEAARNGHLDVVQWVCTHGSIQSTEDAMACAASGGHFQVIQWLHENRSEYYRTDLINEAAGHRDLSVLNWLLANRPEEGWSTYALDCAARVVIYPFFGGWLITNRYTSTAIATPPRMQ